MSGCAYLAKDTAQNHATERKYPTDNHGHDRIHSSSLIFQCRTNLLHSYLADVYKRQVVDIKRSFVGHLGIDQALIQNHGDLVCLLAQRRVHAPDLIPVEVDGGDLGGVTPIRNLVALTIEAESGSAAGDGLFAVAERGHMPENFGQFLALPVQADLAVHIQI